MLENVDAHVGARLGLILFNSQPLTTYPYIPDREHGKTAYPCSCFARRTVDVHYDKARPNHELFIPGDDVKITVQQELGGGELTGPDDYVWKPYPTPVTVYYEIQVHTTKKDHIDRLVEGVIQSFPPGYMATISSQPLLFQLTHPVDLDELEIPLFRKAWVLTVFDLWIDRVEAETYRSMQTIDFDVEA